MRLVAALALLGLAICLVNTPVATAAEESGGAFGARYWRVRAATKTVGGQSGNEWAISSLELLDDGGKNLATGAAVKKLDLKGGEEGAYASSERTPCTPRQAVVDCKSENTIDRAFDGKPTTGWAASDVAKDQFVAVKFAKPVVIRSVKIKLLNTNNNELPTMGPSMMAVEKSADGQTWGRARLVLKMGDWHKAKREYKLPALDVIPPSPFAVRSQVNPSLCVAVKPTYRKEDSEKEHPIDVSDNAILELQACNENTPAQFWIMHKDVLQNAANSQFLLHPHPDLRAGAGVQVKRCVNDQCPELRRAAGMKYESGANGGLLRSVVKTSLVLTADKLEAGKAVKFVACGSSAAAKISNMINGMKKKMHTARRFAARSSSWFTKTTKAEPKPKQVKIVKARPVKMVEKMIATKPVTKPAKKVKTFSAVAKAQLAVEQAKAMLKAMAAKKAAIAQQVKALAGKKA